MSSEAIAKLIQLGFVEDEERPGLWQGPHSITCSWYRGWCISIPCGIACSKPLLKDAFSTYYTLLEGIISGILMVELAPDSRDEWLDFASQLRVKSNYIDIVLGAWDA